MTTKAVTYIVQYTRAESKDNTDDSSPQAEHTIHDTELGCRQLEDANKDLRQQLVYTESCSCMSGAASEPRQW